MLPRQLQGKGYPRRWGQVTGEVEKLDTPAPETDIGPERGFPGIRDQGGANGGGPGEKFQDGPGREQGRAVRGGSTTPKFPKGCWDYFLRESIAILASSAMHGAASFDFEGIGKGNASVRGGCDHQFHATALGPIGQGHKDLSEHLRIRFWDLHPLEVQHPYCRENSVRANFTSALSHIFVA
jgi:hypothetical protein